MLADLIRHGPSVGGATAIPATNMAKPQNQIAEVAGIAVADPVTRIVSATRETNSSILWDSTCAPDPLDILTDYIERLAITEELAGVSEVEAHRVASEQCGATLSQLLDSIASRWGLKS